MKQKITNFLFRKRFFKEGIKLLKKKKGFSLMEVLVAVSIIGIITAIAVPAFQDYRREASKTAGDTTVSNILRAHNACLVLKSFDLCDSISDLKMSCPDCTDGTNGTNKFCAAISKKVGGSEFKACVEVEGSNVKKTYGGNLLNYQICHTTWTAAGDCTTTGTLPQSTIKECTNDNQCGNSVTADASTHTCGETPKCQLINTSANAGTCDSGTGNCR